MERATGALQTIATAIETLGSQVGDRSREMNVLSSASTPSAREMRVAVNRAAVNLRDFARQFDASLSVYADALAEFAVSMSRFVPGIEEYADDPDQHRKELRHLVEGLIGSIDQTVPNVRQFRGTISGIPQLTSNYRRSSAHAVRSLDEFLAETGRGRSLLVEIINEIRRAKRD